MSTPTIHQRVIRGWIATWTSDSNITRIVRVTSMADMKGRNKK